MGQYKISNTNVRDCKIFIRQVCILPIVTVIHSSNTFPSSLQLHYNEYCMRLRGL